MCYYAETDHIRGSLLSTDEKVTVTAGEGTGFLDEPFKSPQSSDSHHLVCLFPVSLLKYVSHSGMEILAKIPDYWSIHSTHVLKAQLM